MIGELHLTDAGDRYTLKRDVHVPYDNGSRMMMVAAGMPVNLLCVLVYPGGFREGVVECEGMILHVPVTDLGPPEVTPNGATGFVMATAPDGTPYKRYF